MPARLHTRSQERKAAGPGGVSRFLQAHKTEGPPRSAPKGSERVPTPRLAVTSPALSRLHLGIPSPVHCVREGGAQEIPSGGGALTHPHTVDCQGNHPESLKIYRCPGPSPGESDGARPGWSLRMGSCISTGASEVWPSLRTGLRTQRGSGEIKGLSHPNDPTHPAEDFRRILKKLGPPTRVGFPNQIPPPYGRLCLRSGTVFKPKQ